MPYLPIPDRLSRANTALTNVQSDPTLREAVAAYGYDQTLLQEGQALLDRAQAAQQAMLADYGRQYDATDAVRAAYEKAHTVYMQHVKIARVALKNRRGAAAALQLLGDRKESIRGWLEQATTFYDNALANDDVQTALARFNITPEVLAEAQASVQAVADANSAQEQEKGNAQNATQARDAAVDALDDWMSDFRVVARVALEEQPQQLEKLSISMPSA